MTTSLRIDSHTPADDAIPRLMDQHGGRMYNLGLRLCGDEEDAKDLVQDTFLQAYRKWDQFEGRSNVTTWLYTIAARNCQRMHRLRAGQPTHMESLDELLPFGETRMACIPDSLPDPATKVSQRDLQEQILQAISTLPLDFRIPIILKDIVDLSVGDIATILDTKPETIKTRIHRARLRVRKAITEDLPSENAPPPTYDIHTCLDLLFAKQEALDRGVPFPVGSDVLCRHCHSVFASLELGRNLCLELGQGTIPTELRNRILERIR